MRERVEVKEKPEVPDDKVISKNKDSDIIKLYQEDTVVAIDRNALIDSEK